MRNDLNQFISSRCWPILCRGAKALQMRPLTTNVLSQSSSRALNWQRNEDSLQHELFPPNPQLAVAGRKRSREWQIMTWRANRHFCWRHLENTVVRLHWLRARFQHSWEQWNDSLAKGKGVAALLVETVSGPRSWLVEVTFDGRSLGETTRGCHSTVKQTRYTRALCSTTLPLSWGCHHSRSVQAAAGSQRDSWKFRVLSNPWEVQFSRQSPEPTYGIRKWNCATCLGTDII